MAVNINLYPPIVDTYMPAFLADSEISEKNVCKVYFSLPKYNTLDMIQNAQVIVKEQNSNLSALNRSLYPSEVMLVKIKENLDTNIKDKYYIEIMSSDMQGGRFEINQYYKIQIRFTSKDAQPQSVIPPQRLNDWLNTNLQFFSEWSTVCLVRGISEPTLELKGLEQEPDTLKWRLIGNTIFGKMKFKDANESELLKSYKIEIYDNASNQIVSNSGVQFINNNQTPNTFSYQIKYKMANLKTYMVKIYILTMDGFTETYDYVFTYSQPTADKDFEGKIESRFNEINGNIEIEFSRPSTAKPFSGKVILKRSSNETDFTIWEDIAIYDFNMKQELSKIFIDNTVESGIFYSYMIQPIEKEDIYWRVKETEKPIMGMFEDIYLSNKDRNLRVQFNPQISSYRKVVQESKVETLGSKFPFVQRNGELNYIQFPISGLISFEMDENNCFTSKEELFGKYLKQYEEYNDENRVTNANDYLYERRFREKVMEFLQDGQPKLFRSMQEGNIIITLSEINLTPELALGRMLYTFSANADQICDYNTDNCKKYGLI